MEDGRGHICVDGWCGQTQISSCRMKRKWKFESFTRATHFVESLNFWPLVFGHKSNLAWLVPVRQDEITRNINRGSQQSISGIRLQRHSLKLYHCGDISHNSLQIKTSVRWSVLRLDNME